MDKVSKKKRSAIMAAVRSRDTKPELLVRRLIHAKGFRFRIAVKSLPGKPDVAIKSKKKAIFVHGCFWHRHEGCKHASVPASNKKYWTAKFAGNVLRDAAHFASYRAMGWKPLIIWECETRDMVKLNLYRLPPVGSSSL